MAFPPSNSSTDTFRNVLRYTGQDYRFVPTYLRNRDPILPFAESPDIKPPEQQGYYPVNSLWTNVPAQRVFLLVGIRNNLANWVQLAGGGGGPGEITIQTPGGPITSLGGVFIFSSPNNTITIGGNPVTGTVTFDATPVLDFLRFNLPSADTPISPSGGQINLTSPGNSVVISGTFPNTINFQVPGVINSFVTDFNSTQTAAGLVLRYNNQFIISGTDATLGTQGIVTVARDKTNPNDTIYLKYVDGSITTVNGAQITAKSLIIPNNKTFTITAMVTARNQANGNTFGGRTLAMGKNVGGVVTIVAELENVAAGEAEMADCRFIVTGNLNTVTVDVAGIVAFIDWHVIIPQIVVAP